MNKQHNHQNADGGSRQVEQFVIRHDNGTYFDCYTGIGPKFGADKEHAQRYDTKQEAISVQDSHYGFIMTFIEAV